MPATSSSTPARAEAALRRSRPKTRPWFPPYRLARTLPDPHTWAERRQFRATHFGQRAAFLAGIKRNRVASPFGPQPRGPVHGKVNGARDLVRLLAPLQGRQAGAVHDSVSVDRTRFEVLADDEAGFAMRRTAGDDFQVGSDMTSPVTFRHTRRNRRARPTCCPRRRSCGTPSFRCLIEPTARLQEGYRQNCPLRKWRYGHL